MISGSLGPQSLPVDYKSDTFGPFSGEEAKTRRYASLERYWTWKRVPKVERKMVADLKHVDCLGADPFHLRAAPEGVPLVRGKHYRFEDYETLFSAADLAKREKPATPDPLLESPSSTEIPQILHFIWIGSDFTNASFRANMEDWIKKNEGFTRVLWTDNRSMSPDTLSWCEAHNIHLVHIDDVFSAEHKMQCDEMYRLERSHPAPCWGTACDILRYNILDRFGGVYIDVDQSDTQTIEYKGKFLMPSSKGNDFIGVAPNVMGPLFEEMKKRYAKTGLDSDWEVRALCYNRRPVRISKTIYRTGPDLFLRCVNKLGVFEEVSVDSQNAGTWLGAPWRVRPTESDKKDLSLVRKKIITDILWSLREQPKKLNIINYAPYFALFENPKKEIRDVISFIIKNYESLLKDVEEVHVDCVEHLTLVTPVIKKDLLQSKMFLMAVQREQAEMASYLFRSGFNDGIMSAYIEEEMCSTEDWEKDSRFFFPSDGNRVFQSGFLPIHFAAIWEDTKLLSEMLDKQPELLNETTYFCASTPLTVAIEAQNLAAVKCLIERGASLGGDKIILSIIESIKTGKTLKFFDIYMNAILGRDLEHDVTVEERHIALEKIRPEYRWILNSLI
jgi:hypothetical protein